MAGTSANKGKNAPDTVNETQERPKAKKKFDLDNINLDERVTVRSLAGWTTSFNMITQAGGGIEFAPNGVQRVTRNELSAQVNQGNMLLTGIDGQGSHPTLYIEDEATRRYVGFEDDDRKQFVLTDDTIKEVYNLPYEQFKETLPHYVVTRAEKFKFVESIKRLNLDSYSKNQYAIEYSGFPM